MLTLRRRQLGWILLTLGTLCALWVLNIEITYRRNVCNLPAEFQFRRHVITRLWRA